MDTLKQLQYIRYLLYKNKSKWSELNTSQTKQIKMKNQIERASIIWIISRYWKSVQFSTDLRNIFEKTTDKIIGFQG
jgi:hypothetical protein